MIRTLARTLLVVVVVVAIAAFVIGYRWAGGGNALEPDLSVGTTGQAVDVSHARQTGAAIGEKVGEAANSAQRIASNAALTAKIKSKMALDDTIDASDINVDTTDGVVTLHGSVKSAAENQRAVQLARETEGVKSVNDLLSVR
jgi:hyperosmotically inducible periplasmic protein